MYVGTYTQPNVAPGSDRPSQARGIYVMRMDGTSGALTEVQVVEVANPAWLCLDARGSHLYAAHETLTWKGQTESGAVSAYAVDPSTGELAFLNEQPALGADTTHVALDPTGRRLIAANYSSGSFSVFPVEADGRLGPLLDQFVPQGSGPHPRRQERPHAHQVRFDPGGRFILGPDLGLDRVWVWRREADGAKLALNDIPAIQVDSGSGPRHLDFHPSGKFLYVINELASSITAFSYDAERGSAIWLQTVSTLPDDFDGESTTAEIMLHSSGRLIYGSNRGHDSIVAFSIDGSSGKLSTPSWTSTQGAVPRGFGIDPSGTLLLVGNQKTDTVVPFSIDQASGALTPTGAVTHTPVPVAFAFGAPVGRS